MILLIIKLNWLIILKYIYIYEYFSKNFNLRISSLWNKYFEIPINHNFDCYINTLTKFIKYKNNPEKNIYIIKYEDLFKNNYHEFKKILNDIGFQYDDSIFDNSKYTNTIIKNEKLVVKKPQNNNHAVYRTWQINQPFISNNDISKYDLNEDLKEEIVNNPYVLQIYPDINSTF